MLLRSRRPYLLILVLSQFAGTSVWFVGNAVLPELSKALGLTPSIALTTSAVQVGFISGTLTFSLLAIADRFGATKIFLWSCTFAGLLNASVLWLAPNNLSLYLIRGLTGFLLAGIYPVGMKIAADLFKESLGRAMGLLVGALVLGTAFPYLLQTRLQAYSFSSVIIITSVLCALAGVSVFFLLPSTRPGFTKGSRVFNLSSLFRSPRFRAAAFGYFGHMWELYAFWAFVPFFIRVHNDHSGGSLSISLWSFLVIGSGFLGCVVGGLLSKMLGSIRVARAALAISGACCLASPFMTGTGDVAFALFMCLWGVAAAADSPQFSTLVAQSAPLQNRGTALTLVTAIGFAITVAGIQMTAFATNYFGAYGLLPLAAGPLVGLYFTRQTDSKAAPLPF